MTDYIISKKVESDLRKIFRYTAQRHGFDKACDWANDLYKTCNLLALNPFMGHERKEITKDLWCHAKRLHTIFYTVSGNHITVVRILHSRSHHPRFFRK